MERKFKDFQTVIVPGFLINSNRMDIGGMVEGFNFRSNKYLVRINTVIVYLDEGRLVDLEEYWKAKHTEKL